MTKRRGNPPLFNGVTASNLQKPPRFRILRENPHGCRVTRLKRSKPISPASPAKTSHDFAPGSTPTMPTASTPRSKTSRASHQRCRKNVDLHNTMPQSQGPILQLPCSGHNKKSLYLKRMNSLRYFLLALNKCAVLLARPCWNSIGQDTIYDFVSVFQPQSSHECGLAINGKCENTF